MSGWASLAVKSEIISRYRFFSVPTLNASPHRRGSWVLLVLLALLVNVGVFVSLSVVLWGSPSSGSKIVQSSISRVQVALVPERKETKKAQEAEKQQQFVSNDALVKEEAPEKTKRRSEFDNRVQRETKAPNGRPVPARKPSSRTQRNTSASKAAGAPSAKGAKKGQAQESKPKAPAPPAKAAKDPGSLVRLDKLGRLAANRKSAATPSQAARDGRQGQAGSSLQLSDRQRMAQFFGRSGTMQDLKDVEEGSKTLLNTKRSRYASFFNRVRNAIARHWHPDVLHNAHDPHGKIYGTKDRTTQVIIVLRADGSVLRVKTTGASGVDYLDEEAVRAIWAAAPFTNPPEGLVDRMTRRIEFAFAFTLEFGGRSRIFRMRRP